MTDSLVMLMTLCGSDVVAQNGEQAELDPGSVVVWDSETPAEFSVRTPLVKRSLLVPKPALAEVGARGHPAGRVPRRTVGHHRRPSVGCRAGRPQRHHRTAGRGPAIAVATG